ncbi:MAG: beta-N-acetylhexosaminidase [Firmicutes bacterium]|nr:beta-N-acetylhexosaminidase [Bacillota bacterium]
MKRIVLIILFIFALSSCTKLSEKAEPVKIEPKDNSVKLSSEDEVLAGLTLKEKIGQLVILGFQKDISEENLINYIKTDKISGFILFNRNYKNFKELYELNNKLKKLNTDNPLPLFISIDEEGGTVSRLPKEAIKIPDASYFGNLDDINLTEESGIIIGKQLYAAGINLNFAPVLDILSNKENKLLAKRSYGKDAKIVSRHGIAFINGLASRGIISAVKHYPGHGDTISDSHETLPIINIDCDTLRIRELIPFQTAINKGIDAVMIGHLLFPKIDDKPATKSQVFIKNILRGDLGFHGIALTDDIEMEGFLENNQSIEEAVIESFNAGIDIFVIAHTPDTQNKVLKALLHAVLEGTITQERLNESLKRIIIIKQKYELSDSMNMSYEEARSLINNNNPEAPK